MGVVWRATDTRLDRTVAVKILHEHHSRDPQLRERFSREARLQASLSHPNIVTLLDYIETEDRLALVMEFIEGRSLDQIIGREVGPIVSERALPIFFQLLDAFDYLHSRGIIHRDIKPSNAIVTPSDVVKVTDLGIAKIIGQQGLTRTGTKLGTLWYMSPEQVKGIEATERSDIYSLGITLYEMVTGRVPFDATTSSEYKIMDWIVKHDLPDPREYYPHIPDQVVDAIRLATEKDPGLRFASSSQFKSFLNGQVDFVRPSTRYESDHHDSSQMNRPPEVDSLTNDTTENSSIEEDNNPRGVGGWLLLFCVSLTILTPIATLWSISIYGDLFDIDPLLDIVMSIDILSTLILNIWGFFTGIIVWRGKQTGRSTARTFLKGNLILWVSSDLLTLIITSGSSNIFHEYQFETIKSIFHAIIYFTIWWLYFKKSKRVRNTYGKEFKT